MEDCEVNCSVCLESFEEEHHIPRTMRCGHTLCTPCLRAILTKSALDRNCPECRTSIRISNVSDIPVSYTILKLSNALNCLTLNSESVQIEKGEACLKHGLPLISHCRSCEKWLCRSCKLHNRCEDIVPLSEALLGIKQTHISRMEESLTSLETARMQLMDRRTANEIKMLSLKSEQADIDGKLKLIDEKISRFENSEAELIEASSARKVIRIQEKIKELIEKAVKLIGECRSDEDSSLLASAVAVDRPLYTPVDFHALREKLTMVHNLYAEVEIQGAKRWSKMSLHEDKILLHALEDKAPPPGATLVQYARIKEAQDPQNIVAFLDLKVDDQLEGQIFLTLFGNTPRTQNFVLFSTGECGPCYKGLGITSFRERVECKEQGGKKFDTIFFLRSGDFNKQEDCRSLVDGIRTESIVTRKIVPGLISGYDCMDERMASYFEICLDKMKSFTENCGIGQVTKGLSLLRSVYHEVKNGTKTACIADCGLVIAVS